jgi:hypothetical protein
MQGFVAYPRETLGDAVACFGNVSHRLDHTKINGSGCLALGSSMLRKCILKNASSRIVGLACTSHDTNEGGQHDEEVDILGNIVEIPTALHLWTQYRVEIVRRHLSEKRVLEHHRTLYNTSDPRHLLLFMPLEHHLKLAFIRYIT